MARQKYWDGTQWVETPVGGNGISDGDKGDVTVSGAGASIVIDNNVVTNAKAADVPTATIKGRATAGTGDPEDLTASQARTVLGLGDAATKNTGTTAGTVAAGDDARFAEASTHVADTVDAHDASAISVDASGFNGNLAVTDDTVQKVAQKVDDLSVGGGGSTDYTALARTFAPLQRVR